MRLERMVWPAVAWAAAGLLGCANRGAAFTWVDDLPTNAGSAGYTISSGDLLSVSVFDHPELSTRSRVRSDGRISLPLLGDVTAEGFSPAELARQMEKDLLARRLVPGPRVTVALEEGGALKVSVLGEVMRPGVYQLEPGAGVAEALASAGGLTAFAKKDRIFVLRRGAPMRIRFSFEALTGGSGPAAKFRLARGDVVVAE